MGDQLEIGALLDLRHADVCAPASTIQVANAVWWMDVPPLRNQDG
jgi:hypothetical protein